MNSGTGGLAKWIVFKHWLCLNNLSAYFSHILTSQLPPTTLYWKWVGESEFTFYDFISLGCAGGTSWRGISTQTTMSGDEKGMLTTSPITTPTIGTMKTLSEITTPTMRATAVVCQPINKAHSVQRWELDLRQALKLQYALTYKVLIDAETVNAKLWHLILNDSGVQIPG